MPATDNLPEQRPAEHRPVEYAGAAPPPARRAWMAVLARAAREDLEAAWAALPARPDYRWLRRPETGLAMLRGRAGGTGERFNLGEASITRCALRTAAACTGVAYILGRDARRAELAAAFDALMQDPATRAAASPVIGRLAAGQAARRDEAGRKAAATRVDFYTLVRGESL